MKAIVQDEYGLLSAADFYAEQPQRLMMGRQAMVLVLFR
jgi:hypothetical protein